MSTEQKINRIFIACSIVFLTGFASVTTGKGQASVLSRVQTIENPELGELIRVALENLPDTEEMKYHHPSSKEYIAAQTARLKTVRLVTEIYMHIKLLDTQIEQSDAKLTSSTLPDALARELLLAKAELEYQRATKLAELRETMHIIPRHALGRKPLKDLNGWLRLDVIGDSVLVFECPKPFTREIPNSHVFIKLMTLQEATIYAADYVLNREHHPVRVDVMRNRDGLKSSNDLEEELIRIVKKVKHELDVEVHLSENARVGLRGEDLFLVKGKIGESISRSSKTYKGRRISTKKLSGPIEPEDLDSYIRNALVGRPERLPYKFFIEHDEESKDLALRTSRAIEDIAKKHDLEKFVETVLKQENFDDVE